jgi:hypothetical protein
MPPAKDMPQWPLPIVEDYDESDTSDAETAYGSPVARPLRAFFPAGTGADGSALYSIRVLEAVGHRSGNSSSATLVDDVVYQIRQPPSIPTRHPLRSGSHLPLPPKKGSKFSRYLRWNFFSLYKRIFSLAFIANIAVLTVLIAKSIITQNLLSFHTCATAVSANLLAAMLVRNEHVVNAMFKVFAIAPTRFPLPMRRMFAKVYSYGGIHSGCGVASFFWYIAFLVTITREFNDPNILRGYILLDSFLIVVLLALILIFAHPRIRILIHNWFEGTHRFLGWSIVIMFWVQTILVSWDGAITSSTPMAMVIVQNPSFWMLVVITLLIIYPWTRLRLRDVEAEPISDHVIKLNFSHEDVQYGQAVRLADAPLRETHAFAVIPNPRAPIPPPPPSSPKSLRSKSSVTFSTCSIDDDQNESKELSKEVSSEPRGLSNAGKKGYSVLISNAGDWTDKIIRNPPKKMWIRGVPQYGVLRVAGLFEPCIIIATGSGIGPCLSLFVQKPDHPVRIIWSAQSPAQTFGQGVIDTILNADPRAVIIDTKKTGRPDLVSIAYRIWESSRWEGPRGFVLGQNASVANNTSRRRDGPCEAVVIISNQKVTRKVVYGLETRGVPAYGAIFDS